MNQLTYKFDIEQISKKIKDDIDLQSAYLSDSYFYNSLTFCVIDSVFSIGVQYASVLNTVNNYAEFFKLKKYRSRTLDAYSNIQDQELLSDLIKNIDSLSIDFFTKNIFKNKQRTSTRSGILKTEATYKFAMVLYENSINSFDDMEKLYKNSKVIKKGIEQIPGQKSGISFDYFLMLSGNKNLIKPDRMMTRYLERITNLKLSQDDLLLILEQSSNFLQKEFKDINPRILDHEIWKHERSK